MEVRETDTEIQFDLTEEEASDLLISACVENEDAWLETFARIMPKSGKIEDIKLNYLQRQVCEAIIFCRQHGIPCRIVILKPRQKGASTITTGCLYHHMMRKKGGDAVIIGGEYSQTDNLWQITRRYADLDKMPWPGETKPRITNDLGYFPNGARLLKETAQDEEAGRSGTFHFVIATEIGRWKDTPGRKAADILGGLLNCCPQLPDTTVILESTASGPAGVFYDRWNDADDWETVRAQGANWKGEWIRIFAPWYAFDDAVPKNVRQEDLAIIQATLTPDEKDLIDNYSVTDVDGHTHRITLANIAWRRYTMRAECNNDVNHFDREYPTTPSHAFRASAKSRFDRTGLDWQLALAQHRQPDYGMLETSPNGEKVSFRPTEEDEATIVRWEKPMEGMFYLLSADTMTGQSQVGGKDPDCHAVFVLRRGYFDPQRGWRRPAVVARIKPPCRWDIDVLSEYMHRLSSYYGKCLVVPEINMDRGLVELLRLRGDIPIYQREIFNHVNQKRSKALGWTTTGATRLRIEESLARVIREYDKDGDGIEINCIHAVKEMETFCVNQKGKAEALPGSHDDDVMGIGIGMCCIEQATRYRDVRATAKLPRDLARLEMQMKMREGKFRNNRGYR